MTTLKETQIFLADVVAERDRLRKVNDELLERSFQRHRKNSGDIETCDIENSATKEDS